MPYLITCFRLEYIERLAPIRNLLFFLHGLHFWEINVQFAIIFLSNLKCGSKFQTRLFDPFLYLLNVGLISLGILSDFGNLIHSIFSN